MTVLRARRLRHKHYNLLEVCGAGGETPASILAGSRPIDVFIHAAML
jgi:hypothetical protein